MSSSVPMSVQDELWLTMDRPNNLMVVDGVMLLRGAPTLADMHEVYRTMVEQFPVFSRRAVRRGRSWRWEDDPAFALERHVNVVELPAPVPVAPRPGRRRPPGPTRSAAECGHPADR